MFFKSQTNFDERVSLKAAEYCEQIMSEMGAEIHDDLIQKLSLWSLHLEYLQRVAGNPAEVLSLLTRMQSDFDSVTQSVRSISRRLNPVHSSAHSFNAAMKQLCEAMQRPGLGHISFTYDGQERELPQLAFAYLYRIAQELVYNAFRHSSAWHIRVYLHWRPSLVTLQVEDDGTAQARIGDITRALAQRQNTLAMRCRALGATIKYSKGREGLLATVQYRLNEHKAKIAEVEQDRDFGGNGKPDNCD